MQSSGTPSSVWRRRTHRLVAAAVIVIGLTMMISNISQCIYMGMVFIMAALVWLAWITMKERKVEPPRPQAHQSPVVFLVTSQMLPSVSRSNAANALDKPPSYDTIVSLDGLPPDYSSVQFEKPPRYEEVAAIYKTARHTDFSPHEAAAGPSVVLMFEKADQAREGTSAYRRDLFPRLADARVGENNGVKNVALTDEDSNNAASRTSPPNPDNIDRIDDIVENEGREDNSMDVLNAELNDDTGRSGSRSSTLQPKTSSLSRTFRMRQDLREGHRERKRNASAHDGRNCGATAAGNLSSSKSLMRLQVPTLSQDTAGSAAWYLASPDTPNSTLPSVHSQNFSSRTSRILPSTSEGCGAPPSASEFGVSSADRTEDQEQLEDVAVRTKAIKLQRDAQARGKTFNFSSSVDLDPSTRWHHRPPY